MTCRISRGAKITGKVADYWASANTYAACRYWSRQLLEPQLWIAKIVTQYIKENTFDTVMGELSFKNNFSNTFWSVGQWQDSIFRGVKGTNVMEIDVRLKGVEIILNFSALLTGTGYYRMMYLYFWPTFIRNLCASAVGLNLQYGVARIMDLANEVLVWAPSLPSVYTTSQVSPLFTVILIIPVVLQEIGYYRFLLIPLVKRSKAKEHLRLTVS